MKRVLSPSLVLESTGVKVNTASPGFIKTNLNDYEAPRLSRRPPARRCALRSSVGPSGPFSHAKLGRPQCDVPQARDRSERCLFPQTIGRAHAVFHAELSIDPLKLKPCGTHRANPAAHLGGIFRVHVEKMTHSGPHRLNAGVIELHPYFAVKNFERWAVPYSTTS